MMEFRGPMEPWPALAPFNGVLTLPGGLQLFLYDTGSQETGSQQTGDQEILPLLLLHGLGDEADSWRHIVEPLSQQFRVLAPDLPGFGRSDKPRRPYSIPFLRDTILALLDALSIERAIIAGSSLGAVLAQVIALQQPERVSRLILLDGSLVIVKQSLGLRGLLFLVPGLGELLYNNLRRNPDRAYATLQPYYAHLDAMPAADRRFLYRRVNQRVWSSGQRRAYLSTLRQVARWTVREQRDWAQRLPQLAAPTLVIWGEQDQIMPVENAHALLQIKPSATLVVVPGVGHLPHQERPQAVLQAIDSFHSRNRSSNVGTNCAGNSSIK